MSEVLKQREFSGENNPMFGKVPHNEGKIMINDGIVNKFINSSDKIPKGFKLGRFIAKLK